MLRAGVGQSSHESAERAAEEASIQAMDRLGLGKADFALLFFTIDYLPGWQRLVASVQRVTRADRIVGSSGAGVLSIDGEIEGSAGLAVLVLATDCVRAEPFLFHPLRDRDQEAGVEIRQTLSAGLEKEPLLLLLPDAYNVQPRRLFQGIEEAVGFVPVVGAGSSENGTQGKTFQACGEKLTTNALCGFVLSGPFQSSIGITQGCQPVTGPMVITKAEGNFILEIDNRPAFEAFAKVIKGPLLEDLRRALAFVFAGLPADAGKNSVGPGEYLVRNIVGLDPEKGILAVAEEVFEGEKMVFTLRDGQRAREDLTQMLARQARTLKGRRPALGFYFNCCARGSSLYGIGGIDTAYIRQSLGDFPLIGLFGSFELGPLGRKNHLLAYTGVLVLITEKLQG
jgi:small ligand-binding sensory domain FIST